MRRGGLVCYLSGKHARHFVQDIGSQARGYEESAPIGELKAGKRPQSEWISGQASNFLKSS